MDFKITNKVKYHFPSLDLFLGTTQRIISTDLHNNRATFFFFFWWCGGFLLVLGFLGGLCGVAWFVCLLRFVCLWGVWRIVLVWFLKLFFQ